MKILVTGAAGFIGFHLSKSLLDDKFEVYGIDNINDYYDISLKNNRLKILREYNNFQFNEIDISDYDSLSKLFRDVDPEVVKVTLFDVSKENTAKAGKLIIDID